MDACAYRHPDGRAHAIADGHADHCADDYAYGDRGPGITDACANCVAHLHGHPVAHDYGNFAVAHAYGYRGRPYADGRSVANCNRGRADAYRAPTYTHLLSYTDRVAYLYRCSDADADADADAYHQFIRKEIWLFVRYCKLGILYCANAVPR